MGNMSKKMKKKQLKLAEKKGKTEGDKIKADFLSLIDKGEYAEALNYIAPHINSHKHDGDVMYKIAYSYFMLDDYERATRWADTALSILPKHAETRVLLARICLLEDRTQEALAIFNVILGSYVDDLSDETKLDVADILEYYGRTQREKIISDYQNIASFLKLEAVEAKEEENASLNVHEEEKVSTTEISDTVDTSKTSEDKETSISMLQKLKEQISKNQEEQSVNKVNDEKEKVRQEIVEAEEEKTSTSDILERLKEQIAKNKADIVTKNELTAKTEEPPLRDEEDDDENKEQLREEEKEPTNKEDISSEELIQNIMDQPISLQDKLKTLQRIAAGHFVQKEDDKAKLFLEKALAIDTLNKETLKGLAYLALFEGDTKKALAFLSNMQEVDFHLLFTIRTWQE